MAKRKRAKGRKKSFGQRPRSTRRASSGTRRPVARLAPPIGESIVEATRADPKLYRQTREVAALAEQERQRLGRQLHDTLSQQLTAIGVLVATLKQQQGGSSPHAELTERLETCVEEARRQVRALIHGLFPVDVDAHGLQIALEELARETTSIFRISCRFEPDGRLPIIDNFSATQLYLIAREAVQNAARHAKPSHVVIRLQDSDGIRLSVEDNGQGLPEKDESGSGLGLRIMQHRSDLLGGKLQIESREGLGTRVLLHVGPSD
jgi:two-component system, LuxR family, sensor kinase FixL